MSRKTIRYGHNEEDRLGNLPDAIILHIFSFMDTKDVVRSGVLSKRFAYLWTNVSCLHFQQSTMKFISTTLSHHKLSCLEKLSVNYHYNCDDAYHHYLDFNKFLLLLSMANVKDLTLKFHQCNLWLPQPLYSNAHVKKLVLMGCEIQTKGFVNWKSLQSLCVSYANLSNNKIRDVLSGCPSLELLDLCYCYGLNRINLTNNICLRKLVVKGYNEGGTLKIYAPNLQSLALSGFVNWSECKVLEAKSLIDCCLDFYNSVWCSNKGNAVRMLAFLMNDLSHAEVITIGDFVLQVLSLIELKMMPCPLSKSIKCLKLDTSLMSVEIAGIAFLLHSLDCLEKLFINKSKNIDTLYSPSFLSKDLVHQKSITWDIETGFDLKLKTVEICGLVANQDLLYVQNEELLLLEFFMKTARFMENMTVGVYGLKDYLPELTKILQSFPRSSDRLVVKILELK